MMFMFDDCHSLQELDLSKFNTNKVTIMTGMFCNCSSLKKLNLSSFNTDKIEYMMIIFKSIKKLCKIKCKNNIILEEFKKETGGCTVPTSMPPHTPTLSHTSTETLLEPIHIPV